MLFGEPADILVQALLADCSDLFQQDDRGSFKSGFCSYGLMCRQQRLLRFLACYRCYDNRGAIHIARVILNNDGSTVAHLLRSQPYTKIGEVHITAIIWFVHVVCPPLKKIKTVKSRLCKGRKRDSMVLRRYRHTSPLAFAVRCPAVLFSSKPICPRHPGLLLGSHQTAGGVPAPRGSNPRQDRCRLLSLPVTPHARKRAVRSGCD